MMNPVCYSGKAFLPLESASVSVHDLGVQRGYGIFDFLRVSRNVPLFLEDHLDRFYHSAAEMRLSIQESRQEIRDILFHLIRENSLQTSGIRLILTGGASPDGYQIIEPALAIVQQVIHSPADELAMPGIHLLTYPFQRQLAHVKTTDYLMAIWLQPWLKKNGGDDILYHQSGKFTECPRSNFFIVTEQGTLVTPGSHMLKGITRKQVLTLAGISGINVEERDISLDDIRTAHEAFITSSTKRIVPVRQVDDIRFPMLEKDSVTRRLWESFLALERRLTEAG
jgi:D-alanine transaminase/branched-chain amino acid aminotransferase